MFDTDETKHIETTDVDNSPVPEKRTASRLIIYGEVSEGEISAPEWK